MDYSIPLLAKARNEKRNEKRNETRNETKRETKRNASAFTTLDMTATPAWGDYRGSSSVDSTGLQNPLNIVSIRFSTRILRVQSSVLGVQGAVELEALKDEGPDSYNRCYFREVFLQILYYISSYIKLKQVQDGASFVRL